LAVCIDLASYHITLAGQRPLELRGGLAIQIVLVALLLQLAL
jgi:hypothetical protein